MNIREVSKKYNLAQDMLRYYERLGILPAVNRNNSGVREYRQEDFEWIEFIICMLKAGISTETLIDYTSLCQQKRIEAVKEVLLEIQGEILERVEEFMSYKKQVDDRLNSLNKGL